MQNTHKPLRVVQVSYDNGHVITTSLNSKLKKSEIHEYFKIGRIFNIGLNGEDLLCKVTSINIIQ